MLKNKAVIGLIIFITLIGTTLILAQDSSGYSFNGSIDKNYTDMTSSQLRTISESFTSFFLGFNCSSFNNCLISSFSTINKYPLIFLVVFIGLLLVLEYFNMGVTRLFSKVERE